MNNDIRLKMQTLVNDLNKASEAYYSGKAEIMSDAIWNAKFDELDTLERESGIVLPDSPTHKVSHEVVTGHKERHEFPALSLPKSKSINDVIKWTQNKATNLSWKLDGMTLVVTWEHGNLVKVVTRGDGETGSNITHLVDAISNIPEHIAYDKRLVVRGEAVISYADFEKINADYENAYENPRNLVAGSLNPLTQVELIMDRCIRWIPFTLVHIDDDMPSWKQRMEFLQSIGLETVNFTTLPDDDSLHSAIEIWSNHVDSAKYPVDGLVVVYEDTEYASGGTLTGHHDTRGGYAFKWADEEAETELLDVEWSVSINSINPVAVFKPVRLEGTTVQRASLCNISECRRLGIGGKGTIVTVIKSNKIIPKVIKAKSDTRFEIPCKCPVCGHNTEIRTGAGDAEVLVCTNENCSAKNIKKMSRFVSKYGFDINGLSEKRLIDLINKNIISDVSDILLLSDKVDAISDTLMSADGWGEKSINHLVSAVQSAKSINADKFLYSLCIPMCGRDVAKRLTNKYNLAEIINIVRQDIMDETNTFAYIDGVGEVKSSAFINWFRNDDNMLLIEKVLSLCNINDIIKSDDNQTLSGMVFAITGSLNNYESRDKLKELIESMGGKVSGSISSKTNYLINNDVNSTSSKNKKAHDLNVPIISEQDFIDKFLQ